MKIETRFKNVNVCPLTPVIRSDCSGTVVRDLEIFSTWLHKVYANNMRGLLDTWSAITHYAQQSATGSIPLAIEDTQKILLLANLVTPLLGPTYFRFFCSTPVALTGMTSSSWSLFASSSQPCSVIFRLLSARRSAS
jgi:hypothetical protein